MSNAAPENPSSPAAPSSREPHRYSASLAGEIERKWQQRWEETGAFNAPNPVGELSDGYEDVVGLEKLFVLDMFPYPSGVGLHVGHPLGYIATDIFARYKRMTGHNVLHAMGYDAFGSAGRAVRGADGHAPARAHRREHREHAPSAASRLGLGHDTRRSVSTTDVPFYRWTQWIFLQVLQRVVRPIERNVARPIDELIEEFESGATARRSPRRTRTTRRGTRSLTAIVGA